jgi:hypothetical protein
MGGNGPTSAICRCTWRPAHRFLPHYPLFGPVQLSPPLNPKTFPGKPNPNPKPEEKDKARVIVMNDDETFAIASFSPGRRVCFAYSSFLFFSNRLLFSQVWLTTDGDD